jgi:arginine decarboxylase
MLGWGLGYFRINAEGHVMVHPDRDKARGIDLFRLALDLNAQGIGFPLLLRFSDILKARIGELQAAFARAIEEHQYEGTYTTVYPIKVNQQRHVVEEIVEFGAEYGVGLECGSKPELQAVLGIGERTDHVIVCNGYKDEEFMRLALMGQRLGHQVFIVLEQLGELEEVLRVADELGVQPNLGVRIKLATEGAGRWAKSGGEKSKFGLSAPQLIKLLGRLDELKRKDRLKLVHFHLGSQIPDIRFVKAGLEEIGRYYAEIRDMGFDLTHVDVGGGLGVDYDGSRSTRPASANYTSQEYATDVVYLLGNTCRQLNLPMPNIISESGRAMTAHHSLLLVNVTDVEAQSEPSVPAVDKRSRTRSSGAQGEPRRTLARERGRGVPRRGLCQGEGAGAVRQRRHHAQGAGGHRGVLPRHHERAGQADRVGQERLSGNPGHLEATLVDRYFCNFSVFQSLPDNWAIDQLFPSCPIHRLTEEPTRRGTLQDITCDSDGVIDRFAGGRRGKPCLELHPWRTASPTSWGFSSPEPTRKSWGTCTTSLATPTRSTSS